MNKIGNETNLKLQIIIYLWNEPLTLHRIYLLRLSGCHVPCMIRAWTENGKRKLSIIISRQLNSKVSLDSMLVAT